MKISLYLVPILLTIAIGFALATQTAINSQLRQALNSPIQAAFVSFVIGTLCLLCLVLLDSSTRPSLQQLHAMPIWLWCGGLLGVYAISMSIYAAPQLGFLTFTGLVLLGQTIMSMLLDHFGFLGVDKNPVHWQRLLGASFIVIGVLFTLQR